MKSFNWYHNSWPLPPWLDMSLASRNNIIYHFKMLCNTVTHTKRQFDISKLYCWMGRCASVCACVCGCIIKYNINDSGEFSCSLLCHHSNLPETMSNRVPGARSPLLNLQINRARNIEVHRVYQILCTIPMNCCPILCVKMPLHPISLKRLTIRAFLSALRLYNYSIMNFCQIVYLPSPPTGLPQWIWFAPTSPLYFTSHAMREHRSKNSQHTKPNHVNFTNAYCGHTKLIIFHGIVGHTIVGTGRFFCISTGQRIFWVVG